MDRRSSVHARSIGTSITASGVSDLHIGIYTSPSSGLRMRRPHIQGQAQELSTFYPATPGRNNNTNEYHIGKSPGTENWLDSVKKREDRILC